MQLALAGKRCASLDLLGRLLYIQAVYSRDDYHCPKTRLQWARKIPPTNAEKKVIYAKET